MNAITLPRELQAWAEAEVAAGRAASVDAAMAGYQNRWAALRQSLDDARDEADRAGWLDAEEVFVSLLKRFPADA